MSRVGISKEAVQQARDTLLARGDNPSIDAVRIELGNTGSKSTIHRYLKELEQPAPALGDTACLSAPLGRLVEQLAAQLQDEAQARVDAAEATFNQQREQLQAQLELAQRALAAAHQQQALTAASLQAESEKLTATQASLQAEQLRSASLNQALGELKVRLADKEQEQQRQQTQVRQLQGQLHTLQQGAIAHQDELTRLNRDNGRLLAEQRQAVEGRDALLAQLEQRDAQVQGLRTMLAQAQGAGEELRRQCAERDQQLARLRSS